MAKDVIEEVVEKVVTQGYANLEAYIREYLRLTNRSIEELELCTSTNFEGDKYVTRHWLRPRTVT